MVEITRDGVAAPLMMVSSQVAPQCLSVGQEPGEPGRENIPVLPTSLPMVHSGNRPFRLDSLRYLRAPLEVVDPQQQLIQSMGNEQCIESVQ